MPEFEKVRISLLREDVGGLFADIPEPAPRTRQQFLQDAFSVEKTFFHGKSTRIVFSPLTMPLGFVGGFFKRERPAALKKSDLTIYEAEHHEGALAIVSVAADQNAWVQKNPGVASPKRLLESFFSHVVKSDKINDYTAQIRYVDDQKTYASVIRERRHEIAKITFTFVPPNPLDADDDVYKLIQAVQKEANPEVQQHVYKASPGRMNPDTPHMTSSAEIAMKGGGEAQVRNAKGKLLYSSKSGKARTEKVVRAEDMPTPEQPSAVTRVVRQLFG